MGGALVVGGVFCGYVGADIVIGTSLDLVGGQDSSSGVSQTPADILSTTNSESASFVNGHIANWVTCGDMDSCTDAG